MARRKKNEKPKRVSGRLLRGQRFLDAKYRYENIDPFNFIADFSAGLSKKKLAKKYFKTESLHPVNQYIGYLKKRLMRGRNAPLLRETHFNQRRKAQGKK